MKRLTTLFAALLICGSTLAFSQAPVKDAVPTPKPGTIFIKGDTDFAVAISAAMQKKDVPATIVIDEKNAEYILQSSSVATEHESGLGKIARCAFAYCAGIGGSTNVSVQLVRVSDSAVVWAYQVKKGNEGSHGVQSMSEAIAKHLKSEYFKKS
jgi:hypothetical protein